MRLVRTIMLAAAFSVCAPPSLAQSGKPPAGPPAPRVPELNPRAWPEFTSAEGGFTVRMPAKPAEAHRPLPPPNENVFMHIFIASTMAEYGVVYADYPWPIEGTERVGPFFDLVVNTGVQGVGGKVLELKEQDYRGHPGRVYRAEFGGGYHIRGLAFVVKNRLYMVTASTYGSKAPSPVIAQLYEDAAEAYLDSFRLTSDSGAAGGVAGTDAAPDAPVAAAPAAQVEGEVDRLLKQLHERNELVVGFCGDDSKDCQPLKKGDVVNGRVTKGEFTSGKIISKQPPQYPPIARAARAQGAVVVQVIVGGDGKVIAAQALSGHPLLQAAAVRSVRGWVFSPTLLDGRPVNVTGTVTVNFVLQ